MVTVGFAAQAFAAPLAYIANHADDTVSIVDAAVNRVIDIVPVGHRPYGVAVDPEGAHVFVSNLGDNTVSAIATNKNNVVDIPVGDTPTGVAIARLDRDERMAGAIERKRPRMKPPRRSLGACR